MVRRLLTPLQFLYAAAQPGQFLRVYLLQSRQLFSSQAILLRQLKALQPILLLQGTLHLLQGALYLTLTQESVAIAQIHRRPRAF